MKKFLAILLLNVMVLGACSNQSKAPEPTAATPTASAETSATTGAEVMGEFPIVTEKVTFKGVAGDAAYLSDFNDNRFSDWYEEKTNIHIEWVMVPAATRTEQINLMLTSGDYPDFFINSGFNPNHLVDYGSQGFFIELNDYIDEYGYYLKDLYEIYPEELPGNLVAPDGAIYSMPNINDCFHCNAQQRAWINGNWLENLDLDVPETTDELYEVLKAFRDNDANGNGDPNDEVAMMGANKMGYHPHYFLLNSFIYSDREKIGLYMDNGKVSWGLTSPEYKEGLEYIKMLFDEGLIDPTSLTQTSEALKQFGTDPSGQKLGVGITTNWWDAAGTYKDTEDQRANSFVALPPLEGPNGLRYTPYTAQAVIPGAFVITDKCENPEILLRWADGLYNQEVTLHSQIGVEGRDWEYAVDGDLGIHQEQALFRLIDKDGDDPEYIHSTVRNAMPGARTNDFRLGQYVDYSSPDSVWEQEPRLYQVAKDSYYPYHDRSREIPKSLYYTMDEAVEYARLKAQIDTYTEETCVAFITGNKNLDTDWDQYVAEYNKLELDKYMEIIQTAYDRQFN